MRAGKRGRFGQHFSAIVGAWPLGGSGVGAEKGYVPGVLWGLVGAVLGRPDQAFLVLF
ncbi:hypothetical protein HUC05_24050, partial [Escherichia coli]|nr:hypothetical protein [Escherichia coli]